MGGKSLILLGLGTSALYMYFCISTHKDQLYADLYPSAVDSNQIKESDIKEEVAPLVAQNSVEETTTAEEERNTTVASVVTEVDSSFTFLNGSPYEFKATVLENAKEHKLFKEIEGWCQAKSCNNEIEFVANAKDTKWDDTTLAVVNYMIENDVKDGYINIDKNIVTVRGSLKDDAANQELLTLLGGFEKPFELIDETSTLSKENFSGENSVATETSTTIDTTVAVVTSTEDKELTSETTNETADESNDDEKINEAQGEIDTLLQNSAINFNFNSVDITTKSKKVLDKVIDIVNKLGIKINVDIEGHTDARGSAIYNKQLSQKRADSVKNYLINHNLNAKQFFSIGYGEEQLILEPNDKRNRRVEIHIKKQKEN